MLGPDPEAGQSVANIDRAYRETWQHVNPQYNAAPAELSGAPLACPAEFPRTLAAALQSAAGTGRGIRLVDDKGSERQLSYGELRQRAVNALGALQAAGATPRTAVILQLDELDEFLISFWACVLGGLIPVPVLPFRNADPADSSFRKLQKIVAHFERPFILMSDTNARRAREATSLADSASDALLPDCRIATFEELGGAENGDLHDSGPEDLAFVQFTSGSTSFPKGVQVTHANVLATIHGLGRALGVTDATRLLNWMPFYHDMGIIAGHLMAVVHRCDVVALKPFTFVRRPLLWLAKLHEHRISVTFSPNFGLRRVLDKVRPEQLHGFDLSCVDSILNGAEPISVRTCHQFLDLLETHCGLRRHCLVPGYGLAEASLAVTVAPRGRPLRTHAVDRDSLGCGAPVTHLDRDDPRATLFADEGGAVAGIDLRIVDDHDNLLPVGTVGHVQVRGESVTGGYHRDEDSTRRAFCGPWLRTGDLGFVFEDRFVITGRVKDIVYVNGQNYYSHDFEQACEDIDGLERLVVIGYYDHEQDEETILAFVACSRQFTGAREKTEILRRVQMRINRHFDVTPTLFILLKSTGEIPRTTSGKIIRHKLLAHYLEGRFANQCIRLSDLLEIAPDLDRQSDAGKHMTIAELKLLIRSWWSRVLGISQKAIGDHDPFFSLGGTSLKAIEVLALAEEAVACVITHEMFKEHDTIHRLATYIARENIAIRGRLDDLVRIGGDSAGARIEARAVPAVRDEDIAIIGMGCVYPQAADVDAFWKLLMEGRDCVTEVPSDRCNINHYFDPHSGAPNPTISKWGSFVESHHFDPAFFNLTENEAITMDPHQRIFLIAGWQAIQDAGLVNFEGSRMGVFVGASGTGFYQEREDSRLTPTTLTGALANLAAARMSHVFNLKGPSLTVDTACSSSLVSVDLACKSILDGESEIALAGGVQVLESVVIYLLFSRAGILSPDGKCYTFSDKANGFVPGEGAGAVVLKRYRDAIRDGDRVYAVIRATAINNDGASLGIMSPNPEGQENVIKAALKKAAVDPADIGYVEAHGTGTHIGDLIEVRSLSLAYNEAKPVPNQSCAIGSVKTNMGHQLAAAGIAGLMKAALAVHHGQIPATLNCAVERRELKMAETPFFTCRAATPWPKPGRRLAAVNSFGFGGTNAHAILSEPWHQPVHHLLPIEPGQSHVVCLSAKTPESLHAARRALLQFAARGADGAGLRDVAYTANARRAHYRQNRVAIVARTLDDVAELARGGRAEHAVLLQKEGMSRARRRVAWLFSGQGSQYPVMGRALFASEPVFRAAVNACDEIARPLMQRSLRELLTLPVPAEAIGSTDVAQPLIFTMDYALAKLWKSRGVKADFLLGHSIGEYVAATLAGVFSLEDALTIVARRGALMGALPAGGGMTALMLAADEVEKLVDSLALPLDFAAYNGPASTVVSGARDALAALHERLETTGVTYAPLQVSHPFHSRHMEPMLDQFRRFLSGFSMRAPALPLVSNVTGRLWQDGDLTPDYWVEHVRQPVQFLKGVQSLVAAGAEIFLEVGGQQHLTGLVRRIDAGQTVLPSLAKPGTGISDDQQMAQTLAGLYVNGVDIDWRNYYGTHGERRWRHEVPPRGIDRRDARKSGAAGGYVCGAPYYVLERRSMFRVVGSQTYPFRHLFKRTGAETFEFVSDPDCVLFQHHRVNRTPLLSGAGQCDLICHLHALSFAHPPKCLRDLSFHQPWLAKSRLSVSFSGAADKSFAVTDARGQIVFKGRSSTLTSSAVPSTIVPGRIEERLPLAWDHSRVYEIFQRCGMEYGSFHRKIVSLRASETEAFARLRPPETNPALWTRGYYVHPGMLDSAFQAAAGILLARHADASDDATLPTMVPVAIDSMCIYKFLQGAEHYAHVILDESSAAERDADVLSFNILIYDRDGAPCVGVRRLQLKRLMPLQAGARRSQPHAVGEADRQAGSAEFFHAVWRDHPLSRDPAQAAANRWLILGAQDAIEQRLAQGLAEAGVDALLVPWQQYRDADEAGYCAIFEKCGGVDGILFLGDFAAPGVVDTDTLRRLFHLFKAIGVHARVDKTFQRIRIIRATRHACRGDGGTDVDANKALATGFLRTARLEFPLLDVCQVDFGDTAESDVAMALGAELMARSPGAVDGPETLYQGGRRHRLTIEPLTLRRVHDRARVFDRDKVFWIIGATSGVGQVVARHLAASCQPTLVLSGTRRLPEPQDRERYLAEHDDAIAATLRSIRELEALGARVTYVSLDARRADSIASALETVRKAHARIDGIYFSALQLDDRMIVQKQWSEYRNMLDLRVEGLAELIRQTASDPLDFFVLFSSLAGLTGNLGQSDYAASNAFMDALPYVQPRQRNCRFIAIQWGPWALGQQVSEVVLDSMRRNGFLHISPHLGMEALEKIILSDCRNVAFVPGSEDAAHIASNINRLRQGLGSKSARNAHPAAGSPGDRAAGVQSINEEVPMNGAQLEMLMREFDRQRGMLLQLFENQNTVLSGLLQGAAITLPMSEPARTAYLTDQTPTGADVARAHTAALPDRYPETPAVPPPASTVPPEAATLTAPAPVPAGAPPAAPESATTAAAPSMPLFEYVRSLMAKAVGMNEVDIDPDQNFMELGADSMTAMSMVREMEQRYNIELPATLLFEYATLNELVDFLKTEIGGAAGDSAQRA